VRAIDRRFEQTTKALATRREALQELRAEFADLEKDFWRMFARRLGCENAIGMLLKEPARLRPSFTAARLRSWSR
jgi:hypothetical protein